VCFAAYVLVVSTSIVIEELLCPIWFSICGFYF
jgi:hypothetical protein